MVVSVQTKFELRIGSNNLFEIITVFLQSERRNFFKSCSKFFVKMYKFANSLHTKSETSLARKEAQKLHFT